jgi:hypothetical protein
LAGCSGQRGQVGSGVGVQGAVGGPVQAGVAVAFGLAGDPVGQLAEPAVSGVAWYRGFVLPLGSQEPGDGGPVQGAVAAGSAEHEVGVAADLGWRGHDVTAGGAEVEVVAGQAAIVLVAMFNRNRQWATERELDSDLTILLGGNDHRPPTPSGFRAPLSAAQIVIGHFFFIHQAQAVRDELKLTTCEFLHATFGEFLVARLVARELDDLARIAEVTAERSRADTPDDGFLYALLSFASLSARATTVEFLADCITLIPPARRVVLRRLLLTLFRAALDTRLPANYSDYEPVRLTGPARAAAYSANLLVLLVVTGGEITGTELFPAASDTITAWRQQALLWRSQLSPDGWSWLATRLDFHRIGAAGNRDILIASVRDEPVTKPIDPYWSWDEPTAAAAEPRSWLMADYETFQQENYFLCDVSQDAITHALEQFAAHLPTTIMTFAGIWDDRCVSAAHALLRLWIACGTQSDTEELTAAYDDCIDIALGAFAPFDTRLNPGTGNSSSASSVTTKPVSRAYGGRTPVSSSKPPATNPTGPSGPNE